jgi:methionyl-tRNA formyltransferase
MANDKIRIIFYGTPEFAVPSLKILVDSGYDVIAVVTAPDKPAGRGLQMKAPAIKQYALKNNIPVLQPTNLKDEAFINHIKALEPDLQIVVAFRMMPELLWALPPKGTFNLHASLLPNYRGAAPINRAIMNGETITGLTTFYLNGEIDKGNIILQEKTPIGPDETAGELHDRLMELGAVLVKRTVELISSGTVIELPQEGIVTSNTNIVSAPKIFPADCEINWNRPAADIHNHIRGLSPYPAAFSFLHQEGKKPKKVKIFRSAVSSTSAGEFPGKIVINQDQMLVSCKNLFLEIIELQIEGKKKINITDFLKGFRYNDSMYFGKKATN